MQQRHVMSFVVMALALVCGSSVSAESGSIVMKRACAGGLLCVKRTQLSTSPDGDLFQYAFTLQASENGAQPTALWTVNHFADRIPPAEQNNYDVLDAAVDSDGTLVFIDRRLNVVVSHIIAVNERGGSGDSGGTADELDTDFGIRVVTDAKLAGSIAAGDLTATLMLGDNHGHLRLVLTSHEGRPHLEPEVMYRATFSAGRTLTVTRSFEIARGALPDYPHRISSVQINIRAADRERDERDELSTLREEPREYRVGWERDIRILDAILEPDDSFAILYSSGRDVKCVILDHSGNHRSGTLTVVPGSEKQDLTWASGQLLGSIANNDLRARVSARVSGFSETSISIRFKTDKGRPKWIAE